MAFSIVIGSIIVQIELKTVNFPKVFIVTIPDLKTIIKMAI
jgi:hypothetical protein